MFLFGIPLIKQYILKYEVFKEKFIECEIYFIYSLLIDHFCVVIGTKIVYDIH